MVKDDAETEHLEYIWALDYFRLQPRILLAFSYGQNFFLWKCYFQYFTIHNWVDGLNWIAQPPWFHLLNLPFNGISKYSSEEIPLREVCECDNIFRSIEFKADSLVSSKAFYNIFSSKIYLNW